MSRIYNKQYHNGLMKVSPSTILNELFGGMPDICDVYKGGARGNIVHEFIEHYLAGDLNEELQELIVEKHEQQLIAKGCFLEEKDFETIERKFKIFTDNKEILASDFHETEVHCNSHPKIRGFIDYVDEFVIRDWKTNSTIGKNEILKFTIAMNLYRYMYYYQELVLIDNLELVHLGKKYTEKKVKKEKLNIIEMKLMDFDTLETIIDFVHAKVNGLVYDKKVEIVNNQIVITKIDIDIEDLLS